MNRTAVINELHDEQPVSNEFANSFKRNFIDSNANVRSKDEFLSLYEQQLSKDKSNFISVLLSVEEINSALFKLKSDKAPAWL